MFDQLFVKLVSRFNIILNLQRNTEALINHEKQA